MHSKTISFLPVLLLLSFSSLAQEPAKERRLSLGFATTLQIAQIDPFGYYHDWSEMSDFNKASRTSGTIGAMLGYTPIKWLRIQVEVNLAGYGGAFKKKADVLVSGSPTRSGPYFNSSTTTTGPTQAYYQDIYRMNFLELPLVARGYLPTNSVVSPYAELGVGYGLVLGASLRYNSFSGSAINATEKWETIGIKGMTNGYAVNYIIGGGMDFRCSKTFSIGLQLRLNSSLTRVFKYEFYDVGDERGNTERLDMVTHYHAFRIGVHCAFRL